LQHGLLSTGLAVGFQVGDKDVTGIREAWVLRQRQLSGSIKARVAIPDDPASNTTYNRAKMADAVSRKRAPGAEIVGYCAPAVSLHRAPGVSLTALSPAQIP